MVEVLCFMQTIIFSWRVSPGEQQLSANLMCQRVLHSLTQSKTCAAKLFLSTWGTVTTTVILVELTCLW